MKRPRWTEDEETTLERLVRAGVLDAELPKHLPGRSYWACVIKRRNLGLDSIRSPGRARKHDYRQIGAMLDQGMPKREIDRALGLPLDTTANITSRGMV